MKLKETAMVLVAGVFLVCSAYAADPQSNIDQQSSSQSSPQSSDMGGQQSGGSVGSDTKSSDLGGGKTFDQGQAGSGALDSSSIEQIQKKLTEQGFNPGPVDGKFGPKTEQALRQFQQKQGLQQSGRIDQQTMAALGVQQGVGQGGMQGGAQGKTGGTTLPDGGMQGTVPQDNSRQGGDVQGNTGSQKGGDMGGGQQSGGSLGSDSQSSDLGGQQNSGSQESGQGSGTVQ